MTSANVSTANDTITISNHMLSTGSKITYSNGVALILLVCQTIRIIMQL